MIDRNQEIQVISPLSIITGNEFTVSVKNSY